MDGRMDKCMDMHALLRDRWEDGWADDQMDG